MLDVCPDGVPRVELEGREGEAGNEVGRDIELGEFLVWRDVRPCSCRDLPVANWLERRLLQGGTLTS